MLHFCNKLCDIFATLQVYLVYNNSNVERALFMRNLLQSMVVCTFIGLLMVLVTGILPIGVMFLGVIALIITTLIASKLK